MKKENGDYVYWGDDNINRLLTQYIWALDSYEDVTNFVDSQNFSETADLIDSFNVLGFHEVCNVLKSADVTRLYMLPPWFESRNAKGTFYGNKRTKYKMVNPQ